MQGVHNAKVSIVDNSSNTTFWHEYQNIYFNDGFAELKLGPIDNFHNIKRPRVLLEINGSTLTFPIYPTLFSIHSQTAEQLANTSAIYIKDSNVGFGTTSPTEKVAINGNLQFLTSENAIKFNNGQTLNGTKVQSINDQLNAFSLLPNQINSITNNMAAIVTSINILETASGANPIQANSNYNNAILKIDSNGNIGPYDDFYVADSDHYFIRSNNQSIYSTKISNDFSIEQNELILNELTQLTLKDTALPVTNQKNGTLQFSSGNFYIYRNNEWQLISSPEIDKMTLSQYKAVQLNDLSTSGLEGAIAFDGTDYYVWKNAWEKLNNLNFSNIGTSVSATNFLMIDQNGTPFKTSLNASGGLFLDANGVKINDQLLTNNQPVYWKDNQFQTMTLSSSLQFQNGILDLAAPIIVSNNQRVGIGIDPTATLDVNGVLRLRTHSPPSQSNVSAGSIIFDGSDFKGWDGNEWKVLSTSAVVSSSDEWSYNNIHLVANPNGNTGIKVSNPQATLDVSGNIRIRDISSNQSLTSFIVADSDGDIHARNLHISDLLSDSTAIALSGTSLSITSMNATANDLLSYVNGSWQPISLSSDDALTINNHKISIATTNASTGEVLLFNGADWTSHLITNQNSPIILENNILKLATQNAIIGYQLTWDGTTWVPSKNETVSYSASNGIQLNGTSFELANNLEWSNNTFTVGSSSSAQFNVNRLSSSLTSPIKVVDASDKTLLDIDSSGRISIGLNGAHNGYSIASEGFNFFRHSISHKQAAVGTTNIGAAEFGPTLLVHSVAYDNASPTRSVLEVLSIDGQPRLEVQEGGQVGIATGQPKATLDINGYARLKKYSSEPLSCDLEHDGSIALNSNYKICVCNGSSWVESNDGTSSCSW